MRYRTLEIRWHDSKPIASCDFQPVPSFRKARPPASGSSDISQQEWTERWTGQSYKLATGGEDNHVRVSVVSLYTCGRRIHFSSQIWMVHPNIRPTTSNESSGSSSQTAPRPPRVEYLATLSRHSAAVNVVRWSPNGKNTVQTYLRSCLMLVVGELIASAGDGWFLATDSS